MAELDRDDALLQIRDVHKVYPNGVEAVAGVSLAVRRGQVQVLIGPSGCGKSTLLRTINGLETISSGEIRLGSTVLNEPGMRHTTGDPRIGMVFQSYDLFPHLRIIDNLLLAPRIVQKRTRAQALQQAEGLLERVGLADRQRDFPRQLSGGQKQRIAIVRALMTNPEILLLDEVTASLDPEMVREVLDVILELAAEGMTMVIVTHEMQFAQAIADDVVFLDAGRIVESGAGKQFFAAPRTERARRFLNTFTFDDLDPA